MAKSFSRNLVVKARAFWTVLRTERATPREIALAVFVGSLIGATPPFYPRTAVAAGVGTVAKLNRLWCYASSHFTGNPISSAWIALAEVQLSYRLRHGAWLALSADEVLHRGFALIGDLLLGFVIVGPPTAGLFALLAWGIASWRQRPKGTLPTTRSPSA